MKRIDLRSDTVTKPSMEMRAAMAAAEVGDDVYGEDPTVLLLQNKVAELLGKESALFTPTGVMANQLALKSQTEPGNEVIVEEESHIFNFETGAPAFLSQVMMRPVKGELGILKASQVVPAIRGPVYYNPVTTLLCLENTHNKAGGTIYPLEEIRALRESMQGRNIRMHLDGARLWNASAETGISPREYAGYFDTVSVCFSKGLGAPIGSMLAGTHQTIERARKFRKIFGGGMRQVGILAAAAVFALEHNRERLKEDHEKIKILAKELSSIEGFFINQAAVQTNILALDISGRKETASELIGKLAKEGVLLSSMSETTMRAVAHLDVSQNDIQQASKIIQRIMEQ
ncbi:MAG: GntG family PLP-dependent aldolase [Bacteroidota bacterium]